MILPILSYGHRILRRNCQEVERSYPQLGSLVENMWETLYGANGCGLAAPQVNVPLRLFLVDSESAYEAANPEERTSLFPDGRGIRETFINAKILTYSGETWTDVEGCLSIPSLVEEVKRPWQVTIEYCDLDFEIKRRTFKGSTARMIQHEYDHIEGILYPDRLHVLKRKLLAAKLKKISEGSVRVNYPMKFVR